MMPTGATVKLSRESFQSRTGLLLFISLAACSIVPPSLVAHVEAFSTPPIIGVGNNPRRLGGNSCLSANVNSNEDERWIGIPEDEWRRRAASHRQRIRELLQPGLTDPDDIINSGHHRRRGRRRSIGSNGNQNIIRNQQQPLNSQDFSTTTDTWTALNPKHPTYNFLIEYYGLKGSKGPRRLARWFPDPALMLPAPSPSNSTSLQEPVGVADGILLEGATTEDWASGDLHLRGAQLHPRGIVYSPAFYFRGENSNASTVSADTISPYLWYQSILQQTLQADPILHCYCLHEWAMQYHPKGAPPPPSAKYQSHLPLRVSQTTINDTVERKGIRCTHVDALRYFAPAAGPYNSHGAQLERIDQLRLEQPACVHAHMDLIKIVLRLLPFCCPTLVQEALRIAIQGRTLDVAASPYDASKYNVTAIPVETSIGRVEFQKQQVELMQAAEPVRRRLLQAYNVFLQVAFHNEDPQLVQEAQMHPAAERFARAEPGGLPWRKNLVS